MICLTAFFRNSLSIWFGNNLCKPCVKFSTSASWRRRSKMQVKRNYLSGKLLQQSIRQVLTYLALPCHLFTETVVVEPLKEVRVSVQCFLRIQQKHPEVWHSKSVSQSVSKSASHFRLPSFVVLIAEIARPCVIHVARISVSDVLVPVPSAHPAELVLASARLAKHWIKAPHCRSF